MSAPAMATTARQLAENTADNSGGSKAVNDIAHWLAALRLHILSTEPALLAMFDLYAAEARFGRHFIEEDLRALHLGSAILEVGAGALLLSTQLVREGYAVTALEPTGHGFSHFARLRGRVLEYSKAQACCPLLLEIEAEQLDSRLGFDLCFSINVMEHVSAVERVIQRVTGSLKPGASYHFTCPNYLFPYEPHFNIPTLFYKTWTERVFSRRISTHPALDDPAGLWRSLNWITVTQVRRTVRLDPALRVRFQRSLLVRMLARAASDAQFSARRSTWLVALLRGLHFLQLHRLAAFIPATLQPVMDCRITRITPPN